MRTKIMVFTMLLVLSGAAQNLLQNPGFETWTGNLPDNWFKSDQVDLFQEDVIVYSGNFSAKDSFYSTAADSAELFQGLYAQPNTLYRISFWIYDDDPAGRERAGVQWFSGGAYVSSEWPNLYTEDSAGWQLWTYDLAVSPSNADSVRFIIRGYDVGTPWTSAIFYVDDAYFGPPETQPPTVLRVWHTPTNPGPSVTSSVYAFVTDNGTVNYDTLFYGVNSLQTPSALSHISMANDTFLYEIPGQSIGDTVFYYLKFIDNDGLSTITDTNAYYVGALNVFINEIYYDTPVADSECYIELFGTGSMSLDGFSLVGVNGNGGVDYATIDLTGHAMPADGFFVVGDYSTVLNVDLVDTLADLQNGPDNLQLRYHGITVDAAGYGQLNGWVFAGEWLPTIDVEFGHSLGRYPDGHDTDHNDVDFNDYTTMTPGTANPPVGIQEGEVISGILPMSRIANPIRASAAFGTVISDIRYYPITIYNALGQVVLHIQEPGKSADLATGVYFIKLNNVSSDCAKIVVVK